MKRRRFLQAGLAGSLLLDRGGIAGAPRIDASRLPKFVDPLTIPPVARSVGKREHPKYPGQRIPLYRLSMRQIGRKLHRDLPSTRLWGFDSWSPGPTIEARSGEPLFVEWKNDLPPAHLLPIDHSLHGAGRDLPAVRTAVHVHGARVPPESDGYPENWFIPGQSALSFYRNEQDAATLWYHDHAMGITRLNIYAGLLGLYLIRDGLEDSLRLPNGKFEIPLILCDRNLRSDGQLFYPVSADQDKPWVPEVFGDAVLVNGTLVPYLDVEARTYRLRLLNASNGRFYSLSLSNKAELLQIGSDQGLLASPVELRRLTLAPGERADVIVDFRAQRGQQIVLQSDNLSILQFRVSPAPAAQEEAIPRQLRAIERIPERTSVNTRLLTLEGSGDMDDAVTSQPMLLNRAHWHESITELPKLNSVEIWSLINLTDDSHPIHLHLVRFQVLDRRPFDLFTYFNTRELNYTGAAVPPDANEAGWKDTVRADPGMVTRIIVRFEGFAGRYVWHCHVLEHEDNEMMRPYEVVAG